MRRALASAVCVIAVSALLAGVWASVATAAFGVATFDGQVVANPAGDPFTQAGGHPEAATVSIDLNARRDTYGNLTPDGSLRNVLVDLPAGFIGNPTATPACATFLDNYGTGNGVNCPGSTQVGVARTTYDANGGVGTFSAPVYSLLPAAGYPASFGFDVAGNTPITLNGQIRSDGDYGLRVSVVNIPQALAVVRTVVTFWGVPADPSHDDERGYFGNSIVSCAQIKSTGGGIPCSSSAQGQVKPFLTNPTGCTAAGVGLQTRLHVDSWDHPTQSADASFVSHDPPGFPLARALWGEPQGPTGCDQVSFQPAVGIAPTTTAAGAPTGLDVSIGFPTDGLLNPTGVAQSNLKRAVVTLPAGMSVNAASADGLGGCAPGEYAAETASSAPGAGCPDASKIGTVAIDTPLLGEQVRGSIFLAKQNDNPFHSLLALYIVAKVPARGVLVKLAGTVTPDPASGQLTATFDDNPQLPFGLLSLHFKEGPRGVLVNPSSCGTVSSHAELTSYSAPDGAPAVSESPLAVGGDCDAAARFTPALQAGVVDPRAGASSTFTLDLSRPDGQQNVVGIDVTLPRGQLAKLRGLPLCTGDAAASGDCPAGSQIGTTTVAVGAGSSPVYIPQPGKTPTAVFMGGPYNGAPFSLVIRVPAQAGPFDLGTVVVRAAVFVDPVDAHVRVVSDPLPQILQGIPLRYQRIAITIDRPGFMVNPTNCGVMSVGGTVTSSQGARAGVGSRFQVGDCARLPFSPRLTASTTAHASRATGAGLDVKIVEGVEGEANVHSVRVELPKQLPSRLTTLQKACVDSVFNANPAACPAASVVGSGTALTPILDVPLTGPAYFVSHGGAAFPDLEVVLQGQGVTIVLDGATFISKQGVTSSTFGNVPDAPIVSFDLSLPAGPHSALTANGSLCSKALQMPTSIVAQNGAQIRQQTRIKVSGCPKAKKAKKHKAKKHKQKMKKRGKDKR